jgi:hypothetical protein
MAVAGDRLVAHDSDRRARLTLSTSVRLGEVPDQRAALGYGSPILGLAGRVVRARTGSPGLLFGESTGFVSAAFTDGSPSSVRLLSRAWGRSGGVRVTLRLGSGATGADGLVPPHDPWYPPGSGAQGAPGGLWAEAAAIASVMARPGTRPIGIA